MIVGKKQHIKNLGYKNDEKLLNATTTHPAPSGTNHAPTLTNTGGERNKKNACPLKTPALSDRPEDNSKNTRQRC